LRVTFTIAELNGTELNNVEVLIDADDANKLIEKAAAGAVAIRESSAKWTPNGTVAAALLRRLGLPQ